MKISSGTGIVDVPSIGRISAGVNAFVCDRSPLSGRFRSAFHYTPPTWEDMVAELAKDGGFHK